MKKIICVVMVFGMMFLIGCGKEDKSGAATVTSTSDTVVATTSSDLKDDERGKGDKSSTVTVTSDTVVATTTEAEPPFDYLTVQDTTYPATTKVEGILLVNKTFVLEDTYVPKNPVKPNISFSFASDDETRYWMEDIAAEALEKLVDDAAEAGHKFKGVSLYRSYARQKAIYNNNVATRGQEETDKVSAKPGRSEHQTGLALDISCAAVDYRLVQSFGSTPEGKWLNENCSKYGFIVRFPQGKESITGYIYEPWHIRYVGVEVATFIMENEITLEEYYQLKDK